VRAPHSRWRDIARVIRLLHAEADRHVLALGLATVLVVVVSGALAALTPLVLKSLVDTLTISDHPSANVLPPAPRLLGATYLLLLLACRALGDIRPMLSGALNQRIHSRLALRFFDQVARLPMGFLVKRRSGELLHRLDLASAGAQLVVAHLGASLLPVLVELITMTMVLVHQQQPALIGVFGTAVLAYLFIFSAGARPLTEVAHRVSSASMQMAAQLGESVGHIEMLRCFSAEGEMARSLSEVSAVLELRWRGLHRLNLAIAFAASLTFALAMAACLFIAARAVDTHTMTIGGFVLTTVYMLQMVRPLESLGSAARDLARALGYLQPLIDLLSEPLSQGAQRGSADMRREGTTPQRALAVRVENLHFAYEAGRPVLQGVDFEVPAGSMTAIVGPSGSGKSSVVRLLMRLYEPQRGRILLDGRSIDSIAGEELRGSLVGLVPQETALLHGTIAGNIALGTPAASRQDIHRVARAAQLETLIDALPQGLDTPVGERGMQLSGGERQRIGIARVLLRRPRLYVLDEPTSMLDSKTEIDVLKALRSHSEGTTMIVIAHRLSTIADADEIVVLADGQVCERGKHDALLARDGLYAEMWRRQVSATT